MSIDAKVVGIRCVGDDCKLTLESRGSLESCPGQETLSVDNPPAYTAELQAIVGCELWGNASKIMLGDAVFAERVRMTRVQLVPHWRALIKAYIKKEL